MSGILILPLGEDDQLHGQGGLSTTQGITTTSAS
jgi:hypothetical protein